MYTKQIFLQFLLYILVITDSDCWRPFTVKFTNVSSYSLVNYIEANSSISSSGSISVFFNVLRDVPSLYSKTVITVDSPKGISNVQLINTTIDSCEFFRNPKYEPIVQVFYKIMTRSGKFPKTCPVLKNLYFLKDMTIDPESLPPIVPYKQISGDISFMTKEGSTFKIFAGYKLHAKLTNG